VDENEKDPASGGWGAVATWLGDEEKSKPFFGDEVAVVTISTSDGSVSENLKRHLSLF